jgi:hydrogenase maturation protease
VTSSLQALKNKILIQAIGNPSRGDDALGPLLIEQTETWWDLEKSQTPLSLEFEWAYQLQIEQCEQWSHFDQIIVIDAHCNLAADKTFEWTELKPLPELSDIGLISSHQVGPEAILTLNHYHYPQQNPRVFLLGVRGIDFDLKEELSAEAQVSLISALAFLKGYVKSLNNNVK